MTDRLANAQEKAIKMMETTFKQCYQEGYNEGYYKGFKDSIQNPSSMGFDHGYERGLNDAWEKVREEIKNYDNFIICANGQIGIHIDKELEIIDKHLSEVSE